MLLLIGRCSNKFLSAARCRLTSGASLLKVSEQPLRHKNSERGAAERYGHRPQSGGTGGAAA